MPKEGPDRGMTISEHAASRVALLVPLLLGGWLFASSTFELLPSWGVFDGKRISQLLVFALIALLTALHPGLRGATAAQLARLPRWVAFALALFFALGVVSALRAPAPAYPLADVAYLFALVGLVFMVAGARQLGGVMFDKLALGLITALTLAVFLQEMMGVLASWSQGREFDYNRSLVRFAHPRFYNQIQSWTLPVLAALPFVFGNRLGIKILSVLAIAVSVYVVLATGGRGTTVGVLVALVVMGIVARRVFWRALPYLAAGIVLGVAIYVGVVAANRAMVPDGGAFVERSVGRSIMHTTGRTNMWKQAYNDWSESPWLGAGPTRFACGTSFLSHPHNEYVRVTAEWGAMAGLLALVVLVRLAWFLLSKLWQQSRSSAQVEELILFGLLVAGVTGGFVHATVSGVFLMPASQLSGVLLGGWLMGLVASRELSTSRALFPIQVAVLLTLVWLCSFAIREHQSARETTFAQLAEAGRLAPRFWHAGRPCDFQGQNARSTWGNK